MADAYWLGLWLEWSPRVVRYIERPADPRDETKPQADYWVQLPDRHLLIDAKLGDDRPKCIKQVDPWEMESVGFESDAGPVCRVTDDWIWGRRTLLLNIERAHPFYVAAHLRGGLKASRRQLLARIKKDGQTIGELQDQFSRDRHTFLCALFGLVQDGTLSLKWDKPLSLNTRVEVSADAS